MTVVKICGVCDPEAAEAAADAGADMVGIHFCDSSRRVSAEAGRRIAEAVRGRVQVVGVFIDASPGEAGEMAERVGLDMLQLHGAEAPGETWARPVIKALKVRDGAVPPAGDWPDPVLLDSWSADGRGGTGRTWNWELARPLIASRRVLVAGGLNSGNVADVVTELRPWGVDVSSGVESAPRVKDAELIRAFVRAARG